MAEFNLIDERWIPCIDLRGKQVEHGIRETLLKAHELREICDDSPLVTVAIHRLLLAVLYRAHDGPRDFAAWKSLYSLGAYNEHVICRYRTKWKDRFFLFDDAHPFMQVAGLDLNEYKNNGEVKKDKSDGLMRLSKEAPDKGGRILFDHRVGTERPKYEPQQIAKMILASQSYAGTGVASGGKIGSQVIKPTACQFAPCVDGLTLWLQGKNLFQTLMLNLVPYEVCKSDIPPWEDDNIIQSAIRSWKAAVSFTGLAQRFAPLSRFIRAVDKKSMFFTNGLKIDLKDDSDDPMKAYYRESDSKPYVAVKLLEHKAAWRDAHSLLALGTVNRKPPVSLNLAARIERDGVIDSDAQFRANVVGLATRQDKGLLWRHERMPVSPSLLNNANFVERLGGLLEDAEQTGSELRSRTWKIARYFRVPADRRLSKNEEEDVTRLLKELDPRPAYWARLEKHFYTLLDTLHDDWDKETGGWKLDDRQTATRTWREHVKREAQRALEESVRSLGTSARAIQAVARVRTDFNDDDLKPAAKKQRKAKRKGGKKE